MEDDMYVHLTNFLVIENGERIGEISADPGPSDRYWYSKCFLGNKNSEITTFICRVGYKKKLEHMSLKLINKGKITGFGDIPPPTPKFSQKI